MVTNPGDEFRLQHYLIHAKFGDTETKMPLFSFQNRDVTRMRGAFFRGVARPLIEDHRFHASASNQAILKRVYVRWNKFFKETAVLLQRTSETVRLLST